MHFEVNFIHGHRKQFVSFVYARNVERERKPLWKNLIDHGLMVSSESWVVLGDFNVTLNVEECSNSFAVIDKDMDVFRTVLSNLELEDITSYGLFYTWIQKRMNSESGILKKLDRVLGNAGFLSCYDSCFAKFLPYMTFDHCPVILVYPSVKAFKPKSLKNMKKHLRNMNRLNGNVFDKARALRVELKRVQSSLDKDPDNVSLREEEYVYCNAYKEAASDEEKVLRQKTKIQWLKDGDHNSTYFHNMLKGRKFRSRIKVVYDAQGNKFEGDDIAFKFVDHFQKFLGSEDEVFLIDDLDSLFINKLDAQCAAHMIRPVLNDEIKLAMFSIEDDKAAGPDGFSSKFFKAAWSVVGSDLHGAVKEFFSSSKLLGEFNANLISFVPKLQTPLKITDYRPIACCNVVYKCINKVIMNRIKEGLDSIVDCGTRRCAFKVDIEKAYDTMNWGFLKIILQRFGFHDSMINLIMVCLTTASFSICVNREIHGFFKGKWGLRQGDPMSPYLFTIVMEVLNLMVKRQIKLDNRFKFHWGCSRIKLTHLCFADDLLMLCHGDHISASILRRALDEFSMTSGLYPSMDKSTIFYGNIPDDVKEGIWLAMPFREGELPVMYLGIPLTSKMLSIADCKVLVDKLLKNLVWAKADSSKGIASVSWKEVCRPKNQGGLGLKSLKVMNRALMVKHLWYIASRKESLWVKWLNVYRDSVRRFVGYKTGNGNDCFIWYDRWHSNGPLCNLISNHIISSCGFDLNAKVVDLINEYGWIWPADVTNVPVPVLNPDCEDKIVWDKLKPLCRLDGLSCVWAEIVSGISIRADNNTLWSIIQRLVFAAAVYFIWRERNFRLFRKEERSADAVFNSIVDTVRLRLLGLKIKRSSEVDKAVALWKLPIKDVREKWAGMDMNEVNDGIN
ncbi:RNA-directed DNA polymerase, eukaryota, reverse transcriptase zinc-binding domain protein [Tanacetum coccineum]